MPKARALSDEEAKYISEFFENDPYKDNPKSIRDRALFLTMAFTGFRAKEILSFRVQHVWNFKTGQPKQSVALDRRFMKGGKAKRTYVQSRTVAMPPVLRKEIDRYLRLWPVVYQAQPHRLDFLFSSTHRGRGVLGLNCNSFNRIVKEIYSEAVPDGDPNGVSTHSLRKRWCQKIYYQTKHDIRATQEMMGHRALTSTQKYLGFLSYDQRKELARNYQNL